MSLRCSALDTLQWEENKKENCRKLITFDYTSSDESELSEDENGCNIKRFVVKRLPWEGAQLRELKDILDRTYKQSLPLHMRNFQTERVVSERCSLRGAPVDAPRWALAPTPVSSSTPLQERRQGR